MFICLFVRVFNFEILFKRLFDPTSQSWMSKFFEIQNPWGKVMKKRVSYLKTFTNNLFFSGEIWLYCIITDYSAILLDNQQYCWQYC